MGRVIGYAMVCGDVVEVLKCGECAAHYVRNGRAYGIGPDVEIRSTRESAARA